jgi:hypothetical protein
LSLKLFAVYLGGSAPKSATELHDVAFVVGESIESTYERLIDKWFGEPDGLHLDSWMELRVVDGHKVTVSPQAPPNAKRLFFVNLGAYADGQFMEYHANKFIVAETATQAKARAKRELFVNWPSPAHTDDLYDVDDCLKIETVDAHRIWLEPTVETQELKPANGYHLIPKGVVNRYLARRKAQESQPPILLFSYGTLQDKAVQIANFGRELSGRRDSLTGYSESLVAIEDAGVVATSGKTHHPIVRPSANPQDEVPGTVFEITAAELAAADAYEVSDYKRVCVGLKSGAAAWVYVRA